MAKITVQDLLSSYPTELELVSGNANQEILGPCSQEEPRKGHILFSSELEAIQAGLKAQVACLVTAAKAKPRLSELSFGETAVLLTRDPKLMMALINSRFFPVPTAKKAFSAASIAPGAQVHPSAKLGAGVRIEPNAVIYADVEIGAGTVIGANAVIDTKASLGADCYIHAGVYVGHSCQLGDRVEIKANSVIGGDGYGYAHAKDLFHRVPHYGPVIIEDDVHIGSGVQIDRGTFAPSRIGANTKIDNYCHFGHNIEIGRNCLITAGMITAGSAKIGNNCVFAGRVSINGHISICDNVTIGPLSGVTNSITEAGVYAGYPVIPFKESLKVQASLASLPRLRRNVAMLMKKLGLTDDQ